MIDVVEEAKKRIEEYSKHCLNPEAGLPLKIAVLDKSNKFVYINSKTLKIIKE